MALDPNLIIIGFDAEWVHIPDTDKNRILSYQYYGITAEGHWSGIIYSKGPDKKDRLELIKFVVEVLVKGRAAKILPYKWPTALYLSAHFSRADLSAFSDFSTLKDKFDSVRKTYATVTEPHKKRYTDSNNNSRTISISLVDTMLISPNGTSLASLGDLHNVPKINLPDGAIERMDLLLEEDPELFEGYAIRDAEISARHAWYMAEFVSEYLGGNSPPITLGGLAEKHFLSLLQSSEMDLNDLLGIEEQKETKWNPRSNRYITKTKSVPLRLVHSHETGASESYHGGRSEAYVFGFTKPDEWEDFDLAGAYTTAMVAIREPDWSNLRVVYSVSEFKEDELGFALIEFKFPPDTRFPCLPVRSENGLIFPLEGTTYAGSPEIVLATNMRAVLKIIEGVIVPWASEERPFRTFSADIKIKRDATKGSPTERAWKEIGNSLYGKLAQGIKEKRVFDSREGASSILPPSKITQPYLASYVTSLVRAVLGELLNGVPKDKEVVSATTDGFITNAKEDELNTSGPLCQLFSDLRMILSGNPSILESKHMARIVLCWKTRGQIDGAPDVDATSIVAKAGIKIPTSKPFNAETDGFDPYSRFDDIDGFDEFQMENLGLAFWEPIGIDSAADSIHMAHLFLNRVSGQKYDNGRLISMRKMFNNDADMVSESVEQTLNMEYDWKRELINPDQRAHNSEHFDDMAEHIFAETRPWKSVDEFKKVRGLFDDWRLKKGGLLKTMADWELWQEYLRTDSLSKQGLRRGPGGEVGQFKRLFMQAYALSAWGLPGGGYEDAANHLTECGYPTTDSDLKNAKRRKGDLLEHTFERTDDVMKFVDLMLERYPSFDWEKMFVDDRDY